MSAPDDYCDFCDLPRSQCVHGQPPPATPAKAAKSPTRSKPATPRRRSAPVQRPASRWTAPEVFKPMILAVLTQAGGQLDAEDMFAELETLAGDHLLPGDNESTPEGELRWRYAARRARVALIAEGLMTKSQPGVWQLADVR